MKSTHSEVTREVLKLRPRNRDAFDEGMVLVFECQHSFVEDDPSILFSEHAHEALHKILWYSEQDRRAVTTDAYPDFIPNIIISFKHRQVVLYRDDEAMTIH